MPPKVSNADLMAEFCIATKTSPSEYKALTLRERNALIQALNNRYGEESDGTGSEPEQSYEDPEEVWG